MKKIIMGDALEWMRQNLGAGAIITSPPDADEIGERTENWIDFFRLSVELCFGAAAPNCPVVFYVTDRKNGGRLWSKSYEIISIGSKCNFHLMRHKIALRRGPGKVDLHRPGYTHLIAFNTALRPGSPTPDVFDRGKAFYADGMGVNAAEIACRYVDSVTSPDVVVINPFCGRGAIPAMAEAIGRDSIGIELLPDQCAFATALKITANDPR